MKNNLFILPALFIAAFFAFASCKKEKSIEPDVKLSVADTGKFIALQKGQVIAVSVGNPGDGGFIFNDWQYDSTVLHLDKHSNDSPSETNPMVAGGFGTDTWQFTALASGTTSIKLTAKGPGHPSLEMFRCTIKVN